MGDTKEDESTVPPRASRPSRVNRYSVFGDRELTEPITVFGPNVAKATGLLGSFEGATVIRCELTPGILVQRRVAVFDVVVNTVTTAGREGEERGRYEEGCFPAL